jgi:hypothetical protein
MARYKKETSRITVKFIDGDTEELLFEIKDRNHTNLGELFTDYVVSSLAEREIKNGVEPDEIMVISVGVFKRVE